MSTRAAAVSSSTAGANAGQAPRSGNATHNSSAAPKESKSSILGCTANLVSTIVGSGIVGIPFAMKQAGFVAGIVLVIACAILTEKSLRLLIATAKQYVKQNWSALFCI